MKYLLFTVVIILSITLSGCDSIVNYSTIAVPETVDDTTYSLIVANRSGKVLRDISIEMMATDNDTVRIETLGDGENSETLLFYCTEPEMGTIIPVCYGCFSISYTQNGSLQNATVHNPKGGVVIDINESGFSVRE